MQLPDLLLETLRLGEDPSTNSLDDAWLAADTTGLFDLVDYEGCALWLYRRLRKGDLFSRSTRPHFFGSLAREAKRLAARGMLIDAETVKVARIAAREGVPSVLLKGSARRAAAALYPYADARDTLDIDLLVPEACARPLWECLRSAGYEVMVEPPLGHFHLDPLSRPGGVAVEIHTSTSLRIPPEEAWRRAASDGDVVEHDGLGLKVPSATELLWHGVAHGVHQGAAGFRLRFLLDAAAVCASGRAVDWDLIGERLESGESDRARALIWLATGAALGGVVLTPPSRRARRDTTSAGRCDGACRFSGRTT